MNAKGVVEQIIYFNPQNSYTVFEIEQTDGGELTCVGSVPMLSVGEIVEMEGKLVLHDKYGEQLLIENIVILPPTDKEGVIKYLSSGLIKGIGEATARKIYEYFGEDSVKVLEFQPDKLSQVKGISPSKAMTMNQCYLDSKKMQTQVMFLQDYGITLATAVKIYNVYLDATKQVLTENPYKLIDDVDGIGFLSADKIAQKLGIKADSLFRIRAGLTYCLKESADREGNTYLTYEELCARANKLLRCDDIDSEKVFEDTLARMVLDGVVKDFALDDVRCVALTKYYVLEKSIASALVALQKEAIDIGRDFLPLIQHFEKINKIKFHPSQVEAVVSAVSCGVTVITGGPGTGKTTIIKCIAYILQSQGLRIEFCTPTGRASKRLSQATGAEAKTIHRLLGMSYASGKMNFLFNQYNQLNAEAVIVDELSMVDVSIMSSLLKAIKKGTRLILVGDKDQLPSVGAGNVLADVIRSGLIEVKYLTHIYRQSEDSLIVTNAHLINECNMPVLNNTNHDFFLDLANTQQQEADEVVSLVSQRLPEFFSVSPRDIQVLAPLKQYVSGVENCNRLLQEKLNPHTSKGRELTYGSTVFRQGDRVMQTVNDYQLAWTVDNGDGSLSEGEGVFNGDIGYVIRVDVAGGFVEVEFEDNRVAQYTKLDLGNLTLAYAITIHKSQGSEFDVVVIPISSGPTTIINKNLLYTAVTRAKKGVVLVCNKQILYRTVKSNYIAKRLTLLDRFLTEENEKYNTYFQQD